jgi:hypothetical protein
MSHFADWIAAQPTPPTPEDAFNYALMLAASVCLEKFEGHGAASKKRLAAVQCADEILLYQERKTD